MKSLMKPALAKQFTAVCLLGLALMSTGCMVTPGDGETLANRGTSMSVFGAGLDGNETIEIQARIPGVGAWQTVGTADTWSIPTNYFGIDFHMYGEDVVVPNHLWQWDFRNQRYKTEMRAIDSNGATFLTFEQGFENYFWDYDANVNSDLSRMYSEHGNGTSIEVYANAQ